LVEEEKVLLVVEFAFMFVVMLVDADEAAEVESGALADVDEPIPILRPKEQSDPDPSVVRLSLLSAIPPPSSSVPYSAPIGSPNPSS
jgi:hypothetical protein